MDDMQIIDWEIGNAYMDEKVHDRYYSAYLKALNKIEEIYNQNTGKCTDSHHS